MPNGSAELMGAAELGVLCGFGTTSDPSHTTHTVFIVIMIHCYYRNIDYSCFKYWTLSKQILKVMIDIINWRKKASLFSNDCITCYVVAASCVDTERCFC